MSDEGRMVWCKCFVLILLSLFTVQTLSDDVVEPATTEKTMTNQDAFLDEFLNAINDNDLNKLKALIKQGASVNMHNNDGVPILRAMLNMGNYAKEKENIVNFLIEQGADVSYESASGENVLFSAVENNLLSTVKLLIDKGVNANKKNNDGESLLFKAGRLEMLELLISEGIANANEVNGEGDTLLHNATRLNPDIDIIKYLL